MKVFFISNGSITNPILHSQGFPHLIENSKKGIKFFLFTIETNKEANSENYLKYRKYILDRNIHHVPIKLPQITFPSGRLWFWLLGIIKVTFSTLREKPDIIQTRSYPPMFLALFEKLIFKTKVVFDMRGIYVDELVDSNVIRKNSIAYKTEKFLEKIYVKYADVTISVSKKHLEFVNDRFSKYNVSQKNILIRNCPDLKKYHLSPTLPKDDSEITFVYAGHFTAKYDVVSIFKFFDFVVSKNVNCKLKILTYQDENPFYELIKKRFLHLEDKISIGTFLSNEVPQELVNSDIGLVLLNPYPGNFVSAPIKLVEYLAAGLPVVVSPNVGDTEEIIRKYKVGVILNENNYDFALTQILNLLKSKNIREKCKQVVQKEFNLDDAINSYFNIYLKLK